MIKKALLALTAAIFLHSAPAWAVSVTINLGGGTLETSGSATVANGSLVQLIISTSTNFFAPTPTSFTGGDSNELVLSSTFTSGGTFADPISFTLSGNGTLPDAGDFLLLRWYPTLTTASSQPGVGTTYGQFRTSAIENGSDIAWVVPASGNKALNFLTTSQGGSEPNSAGVANLTVQAVPEPATVWSALTGLALAGGYLRRRRRA